MIKIQNASFETICEQKLLSGIYHMIKTINGEFAIASSSGLYFAQYDRIEGKFIL